MRPDPAFGELLEREGEGLEHLVRSKPDELVAADLDVDPEMLLVAIADPAVRAVGCDDEVVARPVVEIGARLALEVEKNAELLRALLQDVEKALSPDADEAVPGRGDGLAADVDVDVVPVD